jgi:hypothetical protein
MVADLLVRSAVEIEAVEARSSSSAEGHGSSCRDTLIYLSR